MTVGDISSDGRASIFFLLTFFLIKYAAASSLSFFVRLIINSIIQKSP